MPMGPDRGAAWTYRSSRFLDNAAWNRRSRPLRRASAMPIIASRREGFLVAGAAAIVVLAVSVLVLLG